MHQPSILHINTALNKAYVGFSNGENLLAMLENENPIDHASFLQPAIKELCKKTERPISSIQAVSVINGPGSYTGLRVGLSAAKGICYALNIPLICINTLEWLASSVKIKKPDMVCAMIDARRMEVYTSMYDDQMNCMMDPTALILNENSFQEQLSKHQIVFVGNGVEKWKSINNSSHAIFSETESSINEQIKLTLKHWSLQAFSNLAYTEPFYVKDFYSPSLFMKKQ
jgi:tRNA threonylcarbamoyladenosine biosynthesis protein TsaB